MPPGPTLARLRHGAYRLTLEGESYRSPDPYRSGENQPLPQEENPRNSHPVPDHRSAPVSGSINPDMGGSIRAVSDTVEGGTYLLAANRW